MKKVISVALIVAMLMSLMGGTVAAAGPDTLVINANNLRVLTGNWATVTLVVEQNPGFQGMSFYPVIRNSRGEKVNWDWEVDDSNSAFGFDQNVGSMILLTADEDLTNTGILLEVCFFIGEEVEVGEYTISFNLYRNECFDMFGNAVAVEMPCVTVDVMDYVYGDADGDRIIDLHDVLLLRQFLANRDLETGVSSVSVAPGADANGDGNVGLQDALLLRRYLANRDPETGESTVVLGPSIPDNPPDIPDVPAGFKQAEYNTATSWMPSNWSEFTYADSADAELISYIVSPFFAFDYKFEDDVKYNPDGSINKDGIVPGAYTVQYSAATRLEDVTAEYKEAWNLAGDRGYAFKITLRDDLKWQNGDPIVAGDFVYTMQELLNPLFQHWRAVNYYAGSVNIVGAENYIKQGASSYVDDATCDIADLFKGKDGNYFTKDGFAVYIAVDYPISWCGGNTLKQYVDAYGAAYFGLERWKELVALMDENGLVPANDETLAMLSATTTTNPNWGESDAELRNYLVYEKAYPETWDISQVGILALDDQTLVIIMTTPLELLDEEGNLTYHAAYTFSGLPLVHKATFEACKQAPGKGETLWTSNYNSSLETSASWGPYMLTQFEAGSGYRLEKNPYWYGWNMEQYHNQYNVTAINCSFVDESAKWRGFLSGAYDDAALQTENVADYLDSKYVYFTSTSTGTFGMQLFSDLDTLKNSVNNNGILAIQEFRHAFNLALDRNDIVEKIWPGSAVPCFGLLNDAYYYDIENSPNLEDGGQYRNATLAKEGILRAYGYTDNGDGTWTNGDLVGLSTEEAYETLTGYNPTVAKEKMQAAIDILMADPEKYGYDSSKNITLVYGASSDTDKQRFRAQYLQDVLDNLTKGTALEDKIDVVFDASAGAQWANAFRTGATQIGFGYGFSGNAFNPFDIIGAFVNPDDSLNYHMYWDTSIIDLTLTMPAGDYAGAGETITMSVQNWYYCMNGLAQSENQPVQYNWSEGMAPTEARLMILSALEELAIKESRSVMIIADGGGSFLGAKFRYISEDEHTFLGFGGIRYMEVMYTDDEWVEFVAANNYDLSEEYKKTKNENVEKPSGNFEIPEGGYDGSEVTITFYHTMGANLSDVLNSYIKEFNKLYPNIHIQHEQVGSYDDVRDQIKTELTVGNQPNIAYCYPDHVALYNLARAVVTLDDLIASDIRVTHADGTTEILGLTDAEIDDFIDGFYEEGRQYGDGLMYTMPMSKSTEVLYYNKTFFEEYGLDVPTTWEEMEALCAKILTIDPDCIPLGYDSESNWFINMTAQYGSPYTSASGADHFLFDNDANKAFVKEFREWYQKGYVTTQEIYGAYTSGLFVSQSGINSYMSIGSSAGATHQRPSKTADGYPFEVGIAPIPQVDANNPKVISQGPSLCIFKDSNPQEVIASWLFVKFLTTNVDFQSEFAMTSGYMPVLESAEDNRVYDRFLNNADGGDYISALSAKVCLEQKDAYFTAPGFVGSNLAREQVGLLMVSAFTGNHGGNVDAMLDRLFANAIKECGGTPSDTTRPNSALEAARTYLANYYWKDDGTVARRDFSLISVVVIDGVEFLITWTTDSPNYVSLSAAADNKVLVDIVEEPDKEVVFTLIGTMTDGEGNTASVSFTRIIEAKVNDGVEFVDVPVEGVAYKFAVQQNNLGQTIFFTGEMSGYYLATSTESADGVDVFVENVQGGQRMFFFSGEGVKTYIDVAPRGADQPGKVNIYLTENPSCVYTWDSLRKTFITTVEGNDWYLGCYNTYNTLSASNASYIENVEVIGDTQFPAGLCVVEGYMQE